MSNYKTTIGGAVSTVGKGMIMIGVLPQLAGTHSNLLWYVTLAGYLINIVGEGLAKFFAADASALKQVAEQTTANTVQIADTKKEVETLK